ncbi:MAG: bifunctional 4-hydroxy-2-oxoglutarate aldolase/2-dehydro-3-deoxy-phosphogluconate aldolase [Pseudomonadota bacterium]
MISIAERLREAGVAPVIRTASEATARRAVELLRDEGFSLFEITLTTPGALSLIADLAQDPSLCIGVGTVLAPDEARAAIDSGASFVIAPGHVPGLVAACANTAPVALGAATPSEVMQAMREGADFVKIFPARQLGGPGFLRALRSVFPDLALMPTGGIDPDDIGAYIEAGAACLGMGGNLVSERALAAGEDDVIRQAARAVRSAIAAAR